MRSSTSSSRFSGALAELVVAVVVATTLIAAWEVFVRRGGISETAVHDSAELWANERARASALGSDALILVGASRMQMGVDLNVLAEETGLVPVQLAIAAEPFLPVLENLAQDKSITGTVMLSFTMQDWLPRTTDTRAERWVRRYEDQRLGKTVVFYEPFEVWLRQLGERTFAFLATKAKPQQLIQARLQRNYVRTLPNRSQLADYSRVDRERAYQRRVELLIDGRPVELMEVPDFEPRLQSLLKSLRRIEERGGRVILVRFPSARQVEQIDETRYPKEKYWDRVASATGAETLHYAEQESLQGYNLPDGVHIDAADQADFTRALAGLSF